MPERCPTCGSLVILHASDEGTHAYAPDPQVESIIAAADRAERAWSTWEKALEAGEPTRAQVDESEAADAALYEAVRGWRGENG